MSEYSFGYGNLVFQDDNTTENARALLQNHGQINAGGKWLDELGRVRGNYNASFRGRTLHVPLCDTYRNCLQSNIWRKLFDMSGAGALAAANSERVFGYCWRAGFRIHVSLPLTKWAKKNRPLDPQPEETDLMNLAVWQNQTCTMFCYQWVNQDWGVVSRI